MICSAATNLFTLASAASAQKEYNELGVTRNVGSRTTTFSIADSDAEINLAKNDIVNVTNGNGIVQGTDFNSDAINVNGEIHVTNGSALRIDGMDNTVKTGFDSIITGNIGVWFNNGGATTNLDGNVFLNQAQIVATATGLRNDAVGTSVINLFSLKGDDAIVGVDFGLTLDNKEMSTIEGKSRGIDLSGVTDATQVSKIDNGGTISGDIAIIGGNEQENITNHGTINGNVELGAGNDLFDNRGGTVDGLIEGGDDNDTYIVDSTDVNLHEKSIGGTGDTVESTVSFRLGANFENLFLLGSAKANAIGNAEGNNIHGNDANNTLKGLGGADLLFGGKGNDILVGGAGADMFIFQDGFGHDVIKDFTAGTGQHDVIDLSDVSSIANFSELKHHVEQHHDNLLIDAGNGDMITLLNVSKGDLHASDFLFAPT
jgi:Ca2+-binding RTX toxin-like protein